MDEEVSWPMLPDGEPEAPALLESDADFASFSGITISLLESCGIPVLTDLSATGLSNRVYGGFSLDGVSLWVPESRLEEAKAILLAPPVGGENDEEESI
ncbi:MAG TPA: hypothetical protein VN421_11775 [Pseudoflavonifractor sp.]|nr:hypothetical protein [Pseudoflavonifractor sp.]